MGTQCPCTCLQEATCSAEPPVIPRDNLTYWPDLIGASSSSTPNPQPSTTTTTPQPCVDDDAAIIKMAESKGHSITGCTDPDVNWDMACGYNKVKGTCCISCAAKNKASGNPTPIYSMKMEDPFADSAGNGRLLKMEDATSRHGCGIMALAVAALAVFMRQ